MKYCRSLIVPLLAIAFGARAATHVVTNSADSGAGTLRNLVASASPGDTITFASDLAGQTVLLTSGEITLTKNLTIDGSALASPVQLNGNHSSRIFTINSGVTNTLKSLCITNGYVLGNQFVFSGKSEGGGIYNNGGALTLDQCTLANNSSVGGEGFANGGLSYGGGIYNNDGALTLNGCTLVNNISVGGNATDVSGNGGFSYGGGVYNNYNTGGSLTLNNCTLANNSSTGGAGNAFNAQGTGGGIWSSGPLTLNNSTLANNSADDGGGISSLFPVSLTNSIVCSNTATITSPNIDGSFSPGGNNLVNTNALLAPLGNYGGPTLTMPPLTGSPAINAGGPTTLTTDQRGFARVVGIAVDIGAVEFGNALVGANYGNIVNTTNDVLDGSNTNFYSLRTAIFFATNNATITFAPNLSGQTIRLTNGPILMDKSFNLDASALAGGLIIDGNQTGINGVFDSTAGITNVFTALTITNGAAGPFGFGGGIRSLGTLTLNRCAVVGNSAVVGGGVYNAGVLTVNNCTLANNSVSGGNGGGIYSFAGTLTVNNSTIANNGGANLGGGICNLDTLNLTNSIVCNNTASTEPNIYGGISSGANNLVGANPLLAPLGNYGGPSPTMAPLPGSPAINAGTATTLTTDQRGFTRTVGQAVDIGAVEVQINTLVSSLVVTTNSDILSDNLSNGLSLRTAIGYSPANATITFATNLSGQTIRLTNGALLMSKSFNLDASALAGGIVIDGNHTGNNGVFDSVGSIANVFTALTITNGAASPLAGGGGIISRGRLTLNRCAIVGNSAGIGGGGIWNQGILTLNNSTIANNSVSSGNGGGGIYNIGGALTVNNSTIANNSGNIGGGINNSSGTLNLTNSIVCGNTAGVATNISGSISSGANNLVDTNALLASLGNYGGATLTMPPLPGSPAIDAGALTTSTTDQRGFARVVGVAADIGAVELQVTTASLSVVNTNTDIVDALESGVVSLRKAVTYAPANATITFAPNLSGQTIRLTNGAILMNKSFNLDASALAGGIVIDGNHTGNSRAFDSVAGITNVFTGLIITNGWLNTGDGGGGIFSSGTLTLNRCAVAGNSAHVGGGIWNQGVLTLNNCTLAYDSCGAFGAAIFNHVGTLTVNNSTFAHNSAGGGNGGGIYNNGGTLTVNQGTLTNNSGNYGGGIYTFNGTLTVNTTTIANNNANIGGGIFNNNTTLTVNNSTIANNNAGNGGGIYSSTAPIGLTPITQYSILNQCTLNGNTASSSGAAVCNINGWTFMTNCTVSANSSPSGSGVQTFGDNSTETVVANCIIAGNSAGNDLNQNVSNNPNAFLSVGHNLIGTGMTSFFTSAGDVTNQTAVTILLAPLGNYGGPTPTMPPLPGSPAIDAGTAAATLITDQRGFPRVLGAAPDIGAVEGVYVANYAGPGLLKNAAKLGDGSFQFSFTNQTDMSLTVWASTNVALPFAQWSNLGAPVESPAGTFTFTDTQATNRPQRFYRVSSP